VWVRARPSLAGQILGLIRFYRRGATAAPPRRELDRSHWYHRALVLWHVVASVWVGAIILEGAVRSLPMALTAAAFAYLGHKTVDPVNGLVHFTFDNYFRRTTPIVGGVVDGFLNHHDWPAAIARIQFARNVGPIVALSLPALAALILLHPTGTITGLAASSFLGAFFAETGFCMEAHKYAHIRAGALPPAIRWLQRRGWLVPHEVHRRHHARRPGHEADYAAVTGKANRYLTSTVCRTMERAIHELTRRLTGVGVEPRSWCDPAVRQAAFATGAQARAMQSRIACDPSGLSSSDTQR
jgi:hypothetical protein